MGRAKKFLESFGKKTEDKKVDTGAIDEQLEKEGLDEKRNWDRPNYKNLKDASKRFPKLADSYSKNWDKEWKAQRDAKMDWEGFNWEMKYALLDLRIALEDADFVDNVPDEIYNDIQSLQDVMDSMARYAEMGGIAPLGAVKRMWRENKVADRLARITEFAKTLK